ncbi:LacI family DNA-binding transcriptional regulator [Chitinilyticum piscinae]|uniref:LacI family DNA-binding transcriptional regulator n=1 Tax=Chitinilyticum piscinae TaxID=2866724 RepID=A0A8J7FTI5_9NEIS|nr:LacI family DNA-binding transcriptional regulator [Chitinilyticum piscinae]MBE9610281.1 LacI family DNA-binding transcriptional regulator [Chitinilyticum piscinae]
MSQYERLTIDDIARLAGVSKTTASMVLNGRAAEYRIAAATRDRVLAVAAEYHFSPSQSARTLRNRSSGTLGLVIPELTNFAHAMLAQELEIQSRALGYQLLLVTSEDDPEREDEGIRHLLSRQVDGLLVVPSAVDAEAYSRYAQRTPLVLVDRRIPDSPLPFVVTAAEGMVADLVAELATAPDVNEVVFFGGQPDFSPSIDRLAGYRAGLARAALPEQEGWVWQRTFQRQSGAELMAACHAALGHYPQVVFAASITLLEGVLAYMKEHHLFRNPPRLASFDNHDLLDCLPVAVDSIVQDSAGLAAAALARVLALREGQRIQSEWVAARLLRRSTSA